MSELEKLFLFAQKQGITRRQIGIVMYGKNWRNIYKLRVQDLQQITRNKKVETAIRKIMEANNDAK